MIEVSVYSRDNCYLCDEVIEELESLQDEIPHVLEVIDISNDNDLKHAYGSQVPVVEVGPYKMKTPIDKRELKITLKAAQDRWKDLQSQPSTVDIESIDRKNWSFADKFSYWFSKHYMSVFNLLVLIYFGLPILAPVMMNVGAYAPARLIYRAYGLVCHQLAYRSFFLFGEQVVYPRSSADVIGLSSFSESTGLSEGSTMSELMAAKEFIGDDNLGYKVALCQRDVAIYGGILLFGLLFSLFGHRIPSLPWYLWILLGLIPIGVDGLSQLVSQPPLNLLNLRESTPIIRSLTGGLFGFMTAWFGYPLVEEAMSDTRKILAKKRLRVLK